MNRDEYGYLFDEIYDPTIEMYLEEDSILYDNSDSSDNPDGADSIIVAGVAIIFLMFISTFL